MQQKLDKNTKEIIFDILNKLPKYHITSCGDRFGDSEIVIIEEKNTDKYQKVEWIKISDLNLILNNL